MALKKLMTTFTAAALLSQTVSCGYLLYPERQGQGNTGKLDPVVVAMDAIGLLFFLIPGVVSFIIDFNHETIYLPSGSLSANSKAETIHLAKEDMTKEGIENAIAQRTGKIINLDDATVQKEVINQQQLQQLLVSL